MRSKILGAIAAFAAGTGGLWAQSPAQPTPPPPVPIAPGGMMPSGTGDVPMGNPMGGGMMPGGMPGPMNQGGMMPGGMMPGPMGPGGMMPGGMMPGPMGPGGMMPGGMMPGPMGPGGMMPPMGPGGPGMPDGQGGPGYPPGTNGQQVWQSPFKSSLFSPSDRIAPRVWTDLDYLLLFSAAQPNAFPFVTTGPPSSGGTPGSPGVTSLAGGTGHLGYGLFSAFRVTAGFFTGDSYRWGWYGSGFMTEQKAYVYFGSSDLTGQPLIARPFTNAATGAPSALTVSFPNFATGNISVFNSSHPWGAEVGPVLNLFRSCPDNRCFLWSLNALGAFRYLQLHETLDIQQNTTLVGSATFPFDGKLYGAPAQVQVNDSFDTMNRFYGGQVGFNTEARYNRWNLGVTGKIAMGVMHEEVNITGNSQLFTGNTAVTGAVATSYIPGGLYANSGNIGSYKNDAFAVIPEMNLTIGYSWTSWLTTGIGYNYMYVSKVARPGDQYSTVINSAFVPTSVSYGVGSLGPVVNPAGAENHYWLQGVSFSITARY